MRLRETTPRPRAWRRLELSPTVPAGARRPRRRQSAQQRDFRRRRQPSSGAAGGGRGRVRFAPEESWGKVVAIDPLSGDIKWEHKVLSPPWGGVMATAGNLVFGGTVGRRRLCAGRANRRAPLAFLRQRSRLRLADQLPRQRQTVRLAGRRRRARDLRPVSGVHSPTPTTSSPPFAGPRPDGERPPPPRCPHIPGRHTLCTPPSPVFRAVDSSRPALSFRPRR